MPRALPPQSEDHVLHACLTLDDALGAAAGASMPRGSGGAASTAGAASLHVRRLVESLALRGSAAVPAPAARAVPRIRPAKQVACVVAPARGNAAAQSSGLPQQNAPGCARRAAVLAGNTLVIHELRSDRRSGNSRRAVNISLHAHFSSAVPADVHGDNVAHLAPDTSQQDAPAPLSTAQINAAPPSLPEWRRIAWAPDACILAVANPAGAILIVSATGSTLAKITPHAHSNASSNSTNTTQPKITVAQRPPLGGSLARKGPAETPAGLSASVTSSISTGSTISNDPATTPLSDSESTSRPRNNGAVQGAKSVLKKALLDETVLDPYTALVFVEPPPRQSASSSLAITHELIAISYNGFVRRFRIVLPSLIDYYAGIDSDTSSSSARLALSKPKSRTLVVSRDPPSSSTNASSASSNTLSSQSLECPQYEGLISYGPTFSLSSHFRVVMGAEAVKASLSARQRQLPHEHTELIVYGVARRSQAPCISRWHVNPSGLTAVEDSGIFSGAPSASSSGRQSFAEGNPEMSSQQQLQQQHQNNQSKQAVISGTNEAQTTWTEKVTALLSLYRPPAPSRDANLVHSAALSPCGTFVASMTTSGNVTLWERVSEDGDRLSGDDERDNEAQPVFGGLRRLQTWSAEEVVSAALAHPVQSDTNEELIDADVGAQDVTNANGLRRRRLPTATDDAVTSGSTDENVTTSPILEERAATNLSHNFRTSARSSSATINDTKLISPSHHQVPVFLKFWSRNTIVVGLTDGTLAFLNMNRMVLANILVDDRGVCKRFDTSLWAADVVPGGVGIVFIEDPASRRRRGLLSRDDDDALKRNQLMKKQPRIGGGSGDQTLPALVIGYFFWILSMVATPLRLFTNVFIWHWDEEDPMNPMLRQSGSAISQMRSQDAYHQGESYHPSRLTFLYYMTPHEALQHRLSQLDFEIAHHLATQYGLDKDLVYKTQWMHASCSLATIANFLDRVRDRRWVLDVILDTVAVSPLNMRALLEYGLWLTKDAATRDAVLREPRFVQDPSVAGSEDNSEDDSDNVFIQVKTHSPRTPPPKSYGAGSRDGDAVNDACVPIPIDMPAIEIARYRVFILRFLGRLDVLNAIATAEEYHFPEPSTDFGGTVSTESRNGRIASFLDAHAKQREQDEAQARPWTESAPADLFAPVFRLFRTKDLAQLAREYAALGKFAALEVLLRAYPGELYPHVFDILSHVPESIHPTQYAALLPKLDDAILEGTIDKAPNRSRDWTEDTEVLTHIGLPGLIVTPPKPHDRADLVAWYCERVVAIDDATGLLEHALAFAQLAAQALPDDSAIERLRNRCTTAAEYLYGFLASDMTIAPCVATAVSYDIGNDVHGSREGNTSNSTSGTSSTTNTWHTPAYLRADMQTATATAPQPAQITLRRFLELDDMSVLRLYLDNCARGYVRVVGLPSDTSESSNLNETPNAAEHSKDSSSFKLAANAGNSIGRRALAELSALASNATKVTTPAIKNDEADRSSKAIRTVSKFILVLRNFAVPFLERVDCERERKRTTTRSSDADINRNGAINILIQWLLDTVTKEGGLERACEVFEASKPTLPMDMRIIRDDMQLVSLVLECAYKPEKIDARAVVLLNHMYGCLPEIEAMEEGGDVANKKRMLSEHEKRMQELDVALAACETLVHYGIPMSLSEIRNLANRPDRQRALLLKLARQGTSGSDESDATREPDKDRGAAPRFANEDEWRGLLDHMLELHSLGILDRVPSKDVYAEFLASLLSAGEFSLAKDILFPQGQPPPLSQSVADALVLSAAKEYFDNADTADADNWSIKMALECLRIVPPTPAIRQEIDLIDATNALASFGVCITSYERVKESKSPPSANRKLDPFVQLLPIQVRLHQDRTSLLNLALAAQPSLYKNKEYVLSIATKLDPRVDARVLRVRVFTMMADAAIAANDARIASKLAVELVDSVIKQNTRDPAFGKVLRAQKLLASMGNTCLNLVKNVGNVAAPVRKKLLAWVVSTCDISHVNDVLELWDHIEADVIHTSAQHDDESGDKDNVDSLSLEDIVDVGIEMEPPLRRTPFYVAQKDLVYDVVAEQNIDALEQDALMRVRAAIEVNGHEMSVLLYAIQEFPRDPGLASLIVLCVQRPNHLQTFFDKLYPSQAHAELASFILRLAAVLHLLGVNQAHLVPKVLQLSIQQVKHIIAGLTESDTVLPSSVRSFLEIADAYFGRAQLRHKEDLFQSVAETTNYDRDRFLNEEAYRSEALASMMKTSDGLKLHQALVLAEQYSASKIELLLVHIEWLFVQSDVSPDALQCSLSGFEEFFGENKKETLLLLQRVHGGIDGTAHERLSVFYSLYEKCLMQLGKVKQERLDQIALRKDILAQLCGTPSLKKVDFNSLVRSIYGAGEESLSGLLAPYFTFDMLDDMDTLVSKSLRLHSNLEFLDEKPFKQLAPAVTNTRAVLSPNIYRLIHQGMRNVDWNDSIEVSSRYETIDGLLHHMMPHELSQIVYHFASGLDVSLFDFGTRFELVRKCIELVLEFKRHGLELDDESMQYLRHCFTRMSTLREIQELYDPNRKETLDFASFRELELALDKDLPEPCIGVLERMVTAGTSPFLIFMTAMTLRKYPPLSKSIRVDACDNYRSVLTRLAREASQGDHGVSQLALLRDIVTTVATFSAPPASTSADMSWHDQIMEATHHSLKQSVSDADHVSPDVRLALVELLTKFFANHAEEASSRDIQISKFRAIIAKTWPSVPMDELSFADLESTVKSIGVLGAHSDNLERYGVVVKIIEEYLASMNRVEGISAASDNRESILAEAVDRAVALWRPFVLLLAERQQYELLVSVRLQIARLYTGVDTRLMQDLLQLMNVDNHNKLGHVIAMLLSESMDADATEAAKTMLYELASDINSLPGAQSERSLHLLIGLRGLTSSIADTPLIDAVLHSLQSPQTHTRVPELYELLVAKAVCELDEHGRPQLAARLGQRYLDLPQELTRSVRNTIGVIRGLFAQSVDGESGHERVQLPPLPDRIVLEARAQFVEELMLQRFFSH